MKKGACGNKKRRRLQGGKQYRRLGKEEEKWDSNSNDKAFLLPSSTYPEAIFTPWLNAPHPLHPSASQLSLLLSPLPWPWRKVQSLHFHCGCPHQPVTSWKFHLPLSGPRSLRLLSHMHPWLDPAPQVRNDDEKTQGEAAEILTTSGCTYLCSRVVENSPCGGRLESPSYPSPIAQSKGCSWSDLRHFCFTATKTFWKIKSPVGSVGCIWYVLRRQTGWEWLIWLCC